MRPIFVALILLLFAACEADVTGPHDVGDCTAMDGARRACLMGCSQPSTGERIACIDAELGCIDRQSNQETACYRGFGCERRAEAVECASGCDGQRLRCQRSNLTSSTAVDCGGVCASNCSAGSGC